MRKIIIEWSRPGDKFRSFRHPQPGAPRDNALAPNARVGDEVREAGYVGLNGP
ncbi:MAG: hypothetical protein Q8O67_30885 [Deltaproteobacteria bacterium]|nr:hypothetical protein [Deltaproteobacteria bacterium]